MITKIATGLGLLSTGGSLGPYVNLNNHSAGMVRYNGTDMEVYDGSSWYKISSTVNIDIDYNTRMIMDWASKKMAEEKAIEKAIEKLKDNPTVADLLKQKADIEEKIQIVKILIGNNNGSDPA
jgi:hypothetical protein